MGSSIIDESYFEISYQKDNETEIKRGRGTQQKATVFVNGIHKTIKPERIGKG